MADDTDRVVETMSGFVMTAPGEDVFAFTELAPFRYVGRFVGLGGIAAYDLQPGGEIEIETAGKILTTVEPHPDYPDGWPDWVRRPNGPKRQLAVGDERFALYTVGMTSAFRIAEMFVERWNPRGAAVVLDEADARLYILIETGPEWSCPLEAVWDMTVVDAWDQGWR